MKLLGSLGSHGCASHYRASLSTITRWRQVLGIRAQYRSRKPTYHGARQRGRLGFGPRRDLQHQDWSLAGQAADYLRKYGAVYRCGDRGKPNVKGSFWNRNGHVLTDEDIIHRATRLGWSPHGSSWK